MLGFGACKVDGRNLGLSGCEGLVSEGLGFRVLAIALLGDLRCTRFPPPTEALENLERSKP